jgi:hypothetical protein
LEENREDARKKAEAAAAQYRDRYKEYMDTLQRELLTARKDASERIQSNLRILALSEWDKVISEWRKKSLRVIDEPWLSVEAVNQY